VDNIKKFVIASAITEAEMGNLEVYRDFLNEFTGLDIANKAFWSPQSVSIFGVYMELFAELVRCGSCMYFDSMW
jgi:hypothetical protein